MTAQRLTVRLATWSARHPWRAIVSWLLLVVVCLGVGSAAGTRMADTTDYRVGEAGRAEAMAEAGGIPQPIVENVVITARGGSLDVTAAEAAAQDVSRRMADLPAVSRVGDPLRAPDGQAYLVPLTMRGDDVAVAKGIKDVVARTAEVQRANPAVQVVQTGHASMSVDVGKQMSKDLALGERLTLPLTLVILMVVFGAVVAAGIPVLLALSGVAAAMGLSALFSHVFPSVGTNNNLILLMGMAVGVDYSLLVTKRFREERARSGGELGDAAAIELAAATAGRAALVAGAAVMLAMASLFAIGDVVFSSLAISSIIVVLIVMTGSVIVLPALLVKLGRVLDRPRLPLLGRLAKQSSEPGRLWPRLLAPAVRHPGRTLAAGLVVIAALALPALGMRLISTEVGTLPKVPAVQARDRMVAHFPSAGAAFTVVVQGSAAQADAAVDALTTATAADPLLSAGRLPATTLRSADGTTGSLTLTTPYPVDGPQARQALERLRHDLVPAVANRADGPRAAVTGDVARNQDVLDRQLGELPWVIGLLLLFSFAVLLAAFRSVLIALVCTLLNVLSSAAALGMLVGVFQSGPVTDLIGHHADGSIVSRVPIFLFVILFGLSTDYNVFMVSRIKESMEKGSSTADALVEGLGRSAGVVTGGAFIMVSVFVSFMFTSLLEMKQLGFGLCVAVLVDVVIVRLMVMPALLKLIGHRLRWSARPAVRPGATPDAAAAADSAAGPAVLPEPNLPVHH
ncbi:MMPL family transporter [Kitasatospora xanthocidica]|uniref:MMPL family transporter n=1 Tax=Kitasatospora xanthocidica TaxID=83382 RepID=UPI0036ED5943